MPIFLRILRLTSNERSLLVEATILLWATWIGLRLFRFVTLRRRLDGLARTGTARKKPPASAVDRLAWAVDAAGRRAAISTCLTRAMTLQTMLARRGFRSDLHLGVAKDESFQAHAWVEYDGRIVIGGPRVDQYTPLTSFDADYNRAPGHQ